MMTGRKGDQRRKGSVEAGGQMYPSVQACWGPWSEGGVCVCVCACACACACVCVCCGRVVVEVDGFKGGKVEVTGDAVPRNQTAHS